MSSSKPRREERTPIELGHLDPEAREHPRELDRDVAAPDHDESLRKPLEVEDVVGADGMLDPGDVRKRGLPARRDEDVAGGDRASVDRDRVRAGDGRARVEESRPRPLDEPPVDPVQAPDLAVLVRDEGWPVEGGKT